MKKGAQFRGDFKKTLKEYKLKNWGGKTFIWLLLSCLLECQLH